MKNNHKMTNRLLVTILSLLMLFSAGPFFFAENMSAYADANNVDSWAKLKTAINTGGTITLTKDIVAEDTITIPNDVTVTITGGKTIYSKAGRDKYDSMFKVESGGKLTIDEGTTLSGKTSNGSSQSCPDINTYTADKFTGDLSADGKTYEPKGFFIQVEGGGSATLNGTISDFVTSRNKATTPRYVAPVVANGANAKFDLGSTGVIKNNLVGYIVDDSKAYEDAQTIKQYVKGAPPNTPRKPNAATQKSNKSNFGGRARERNAGIDGGAAGSGITATAGAVIYKDGAQGSIQGSITNNRADTGGIMVSGEDTTVNIEDGTRISRNVGVQFGGGSTVEQGGTIVMNAGEMYENVAWFGGGAVYATENGVAWLLGLMSGSDYLKPQFDSRIDGVFEMQGGSLHDNTAFTRGGAILADSDGVRVVKGKLQNNLSRMLGGAVYVMGDHPLYTYTMRLDSVYIHDNTAVSGQYSNDPNNQWNNNNYGGATFRPEKQNIDGMPASQNLDAKNKLLQTKLITPGNGCTDANNPILDANDLISKNTDDSKDGQGSDGTGGGVWLCAYGNTTFDAGKPERVVIANNYATGTKGSSPYEPTKSAFRANTVKSDQSWSGRAGGSDFHSDTGDIGTVVIKNWDSDTSTWMNENTNDPLTQADSVSDKILNLVSKGNVRSMDNPNVEVSGNISRRGGGLAADGTFYLGVSEDQVNVETSVGLGKRWAPAADKRPLAIRVTAKAGDKEAVVADVPLDGKANPPLGEFESVKELDPTTDSSGFTIWNGHFTLPLQLKATDDSKIDVFNFTMSDSYKSEYVTDDPENYPTLIPSPGDISPITATGRDNLAKLLTLIRNSHRNDQGVVDEEAVKEAIKEAVRITFNNNLTFECTELEAEYNSTGALVVKTNDEGEAIKTSSYVLTWDEIDLSNTEFNLATTPQLATITKDDGSQETIELYQIHLLGIDLTLNATNDNEPIVEKYVNKDVHADIVDFDKEFTYDIVAYVPMTATELTISDELVNGLEFADKDGKKTENAQEAIQRIAIQTINNHKTGNEGTVSSPVSENLGIKKGTVNATINGNKLSITIDNDSQTTAVGTVPEKNALKAAQGKWVQLTFNARIKDDYRDIEALKELTSGVTKPSNETDSWEGTETNKQGHEAKVYVMGNGDLALVAALTAKIGPDEIIWAVEGPSRLFAKTASGKYYATPMSDEKKGNIWELCKEGSTDWINANNRFTGTPPEAYNTRGSIDLSSSLLDNLKELPDVKRETVVEACEGPQRLFAKTSNGDYYLTPVDDKSGTVWVKAVEGSDEWNNAHNRFERTGPESRNTVRFFNLDPEDSTITLDPSKMTNWPVISDEKHEGMANQGTYSVKFGNNATGTYKSNTVTVNPDTQELEATKKWVGAKKDEIPSPEDFKSFLILKSIKTNEDGTATEDIISDKYLKNLKVTRNDDGTYTAKWTGLPNLKSTEYNYDFDEKEMPGFTTAIDKATKTITNTKKREEKPEIEKYVNQAVHKDIKLDEVFTYDIVAYITKDADSVTITDKLNDVLTFESKAEDIKVADLGEDNNHLVTNNISNVKVNDNASVAQEGKSVDAAEVTINGQDLKVFITNKMRVITEAYDPVEIETINPKKEGYYEKPDGGVYEKTKDTDIVDGKTYYTENAGIYTVVDPPSKDEIENYYENVEYILTKDSKLEEGKTYYTKNGDEFSEVTITPVNPQGLGYFEEDGDGYKETADTTPVAGKIYYEKKTITDGSRGYEYDGDDQPVTALRGHWVKVSFKAKIKDGLKVEDVKNAFATINSNQAEQDRAEENVGNAPVVSAEDHMGIPNNAKYSIGVANEAGIQEDVYGDKSNTVTVKPEDKSNDNGLKPDNENDSDDVAPDNDDDDDEVKGADTGDETKVMPWMMMFILSAAAVTTGAVYRRKRSR